MLNMNKVHAETIVIAADEWCPYNCKLGLTREGFQVEVLRAVMAKSNIEVKYITLPYTRALKAAEHGEIDGVFGALRSESDILIYPEENIGLSTNVVVSKVSSTHTYNKATDLVGKQIAAIRGYNYGNEIDRILSDASKTKVTWLHGENAFTQGMNMVQSGRVDGFIDDVNVINEYLQREAILHKFKTGSALTQLEPTYIAFSPQIQKKLQIKEKFSNGFAMLKADGGLDSIFVKYGIVDEKEPSKEEVIKVCSETWPPYFAFKDEQGQTAGVLNDYVTTIAERLHKKIVLDVLPFKNCQRKVKQGKYYAQMGISAEEGDLITGKHFAIVWELTPFITENEYQNNNDLARLSDFSQWTWLKDKDYEYPDILQSINWKKIAPITIYDTEYIKPFRVLAKVPRSVFFEDYYWSINIIEKNKLPVKALRNLSYIEPNYTGFNKKYEEFAREWDQALGEVISSGQINRIYRKWTGINAPNAVLTQNVD